MVIRIDQRILCLCGDLTLVDKEMFPELSLFSFSVFSKPFHQKKPALDTEKQIGAEIALRFMPFQFHPFSHGVHRKSRLGSHSSMRRSMVIQLGGRPSAGGVGGDGSNPYTYSAGSGLVEDTVVPDGVLPPEGARRSRSRSPGSSSAAGGGSGRSSSGNGQRSGAIPLSYFAANVSSPRRPSQNLVPQVVTDPALGKVFGTSASGSSSRSTPMGGGGYRQSEGYRAAMNNSSYDQADVEQDDGGGQGYAVAPPMRKGQGPTNYAALRRGGSGGYRQNAAMALAQSQQRPLEPDPLPTVAANYRGLANNRSASIPTISPESDDAAADYAAAVGLPYNSSRHPSPARLSGEGGMEEGDSLPQAPAVVTFEEEDGPLGAARRRSASAGRSAGYREAARMAAEEYRAHHVALQQRREQESVRRSRERTDVMDGASRSAPVSPRSQEYGRELSSGGVSSARRSAAALAEVDPRVPDREIQRSQTEMRRALLLESPRGLPPNPNEEGAGLEGDGAPPPSPSAATAVSTSDGATVAAVATAPPSAQASPLAGTIPTIPPLPKQHRPKHPMAPGAAAAPTQPRGAGPAQLSNQQKQQLVAEACKERDEEILQLRAALQRLHLRAGSPAPGGSVGGTPGRPSIARGDLSLTGDLHSSSLGRQARIEGAPPHVDGLPFMSIPLFVNGPIPMHSGWLHMLEFEEHLFSKKSWKRRFVVADDRGVSIYKDEMDFNSHSYTKLDRAVLYRQCQYFVPHFRASAVVATTADGVSMYHPYAIDPNQRYFGFLAKQPVGLAGSTSAPENPTLLFKTDSQTDHEGWSHFFARQFNIDLYRDMFPMMFAPPSRAQTPRPASAPLPQDPVPQLAPPSTTPPADAISVSSRSDSGEGHDPAAATAVGPDLPSIPPTTDGDPGTAVEARTADSRQAAVPKVYREMEVQCVLLDPATSSAPAAAAPSQVQPAEQHHDTFVPPPPPSSSPPRTALQAQPDPEVTLDAPFGAADGVRWPNNGGTNAAAGPSRLTAQRLGSPSTPSALPSAPVRVYRIAEVQTDPVEFKTYNPPQTQPQQLDPGRVGEPSSSPLNPNGTPVNLNAWNRPAAGAAANGAPSGSPVSLTPSGGPVGVPLVSPTAFIALQRQQAETASSLKDAQNELTELRQVVKDLQEENQQLQGLATGSSEHLQSVREGLEISQNEVRRLRGNLKTIQQLVLKEAPATFAKLEGAGSSGSGGSLVLPRLAEVSCQTIDVGGSSGPAMAAPSTPVAVGLNATTGASLAGPQPSSPPSVANNNRREQVANTVEPSVARPPQGRSNAVNSMPDVAAELWTDPASSVTAELDDGLSEAIGTGSGRQTLQQVVAERDALQRELLRTKSEYRDALKEVCGMAIENLDVAHNHYRLGMANALEKGGVGQDDQDLVEANPEGDGIWTGLGSRAQVGGPPLIMLLCSRTQIDPRGRNGRARVNRNGGAAAAAAGFGSLHEDADFEREEDEDGSETVSSPTPTLDRNNGEEGLDEEPLFLPNAVTVGCAVDAGSIGLLETRGDKRRGNGQSSLFPTRRGWTFHDYISESLIKLDVEVVPFLGGRRPVSLGVGSGQSTVTQKPPQQSNASQPSRRSGSQDSRVSSHTKSGTATTVTTGASRLPTRTSAAVNRKLNLRGPSTTAQWRPTREEPVIPHTSKFAADIHARANSRRRSSSVS